MVVPPSFRGRRPFEDQAPRPFHRTNEFQLFLRFGGLLVFLGIAGFYFWLSRKGADLPNRTDLVEEPARTSPVTPEEQVERDRKLYSVFEGALVDSKNGDALVETAGYYKLLKTVGDYTPEEVSERAQRPLAYKAALADADGWRGEFVWRRGILAGLPEPVKLDTRAYGREVVHRGLLSDPDVEEGVLFDLTHLPAESLEHARQAYDLEGVFYRLVTYEARNGTARQVPWIIARNLRPVPDAHEGRQALFAKIGPWLLVAMALILGVMLFYSLRRGPRGAARAPRQPPESIREMFERRLREEGRPPPPPASP